MAETSQIQPHVTPAENWFEETFLWKIKLWLSFTGWLLYLTNFVAVLLMLLLAAIGSWIGVWPMLLVWVPLGIAAILAANLCFDIATVRYDLRPRERVPAPRTDLDAFDLMRARVSCRSFQSRNLTPDHLAELMEVVRVKSDPENQLGSHPIRLEYIAAPLTVWPVVGGHEFLVAIAPVEYSRLSVIDIGRSLQKVVLHATQMGLSTCWIGPGADQGSVIHHLGDRFDPARDHVICVCAVGYASRFRPLALRGMQRAQRKRLPLDELFFSDPTFSAPLDTDTAPFDAFKRCFEVCQWSPSAYNGQTTRCAAVSAQVEGEKKLVRIDFCASTHSKYYAAVAVGIWCANWETGCEALEKRGRFEVLSPKARGDEGIPELPQYDLSWILE
ncbi:MAG: nitroreductase [Gammaproteobacteria bacterium]|nr:nitroreductase [Gammaproteobacteria bacterium]